ncbi:hypothetical protein CAPTEDRAFT_27387, partial [Capitella teleta]
QVVVEVFNNLLTESLTIHWHGMHQKKSPYMDGAAYISQCPIQAKQKFTYKFKAYPAGTHFYHGSFANQRVDGLFGMIIVHKQLPTIPEIPLTVTDWFKEEALTIDLNSPYRFGVKGAGQLTPFSTLLGGRGRWNDNTYPLREYTVETGRNHKFRLASSAMEHTYEVSIDGHVLTLVALDGQEINPI